jgi:hypothetical protein
VYDDFASAASGMAAEERNRRLVNWAFMLVNPCFSGLQAYENRKTEGGKTRSDATPRRTIPAEY